MTELVPSPYPGLFTSPSFAPREVFSVSQVEKAFGSAHEPGRGCLRSWALRYLAGLKEPEYTYAEACALPENTEALKKLKGGIKKKTYGKVFHSIAEAYYRGEQLNLADDAANRFFSGSHLAPHPSQCVTIEIEKPIKVRTGPEQDTITWNGFKDLVVSLDGVTRYLFDWKTTTPTVDNRRNRDAGKPPGSWTWQKDNKAIRIDYQANLYAYDELVNHGALPRGRWIYFANSGKPDARATDYEPEHELVLETVRMLDGHARVLRDHIRHYRTVRHTDLATNIETLRAIEPNLSNCAAFGGCPYRSSVGGPCTAEQNGVIPVGSLSRTITRPDVKPRTSISPSFTFEVGAIDMNVHEQIEAAKQARLAAGGNAPPAPNGFVPQGVPPHVPGYTHNTGAPIPTAGMPPVFAAPTVPAPAPGQPPAAFDPSFAFGAAPAAPAPAPAWTPPGPLTLPAPGQNVFGSPSASNALWATDAAGGWFELAQVHAMAVAGHPQARALFVAPTAPETFPSHVNPPEASNPNLPTVAEKPKRGRPAKDKTPAESSAAAQPLRDTTPAPADFDAPELTVTLKIGRSVITVPAPEELTESLQAYVLKAVSG